MNKLLSRRGLVVGCWGLTLVLGMALARNSFAHADKSPHLVHNVFFTLKDHSPEAIDRLVASCEKHLTKHQGCLYFAAGPLAKELNRPVNDREFDVALTIVFASKNDHDAYQTAARHLDFINENKPTLDKVRVFDSYTSAESP